MAEKAEKRPGTGEGIVVLPAGEAAVILEDEQGHRFRLSSETVEKKRHSRSPVRRAVPAGKYRVLGIHAIDRSRRDQVWHLSTSGRRLGTLEVTEGEEVPYELDRTVHIEGALQEGKRISVSVRHTSGAGLTLYRDGRRIPMSYRLVDRRKKTLRSGKITYG